MYRRKHISEMLWTDAESGRVTQTQRFDGSVSKPGPEPIVVGDSDNVVKEIRVAAVTKPKSTPDQVEDLLRQLLAGMASPAPVSAPVLEVPMVEKLLQRLVAETQIRHPAPVIPPEPVGLEHLLRSYLSGQQTSGQQPRQRSIKLEWYCVFFMRKGGS